MGGVKVSKLVPLALLLTAIPTAFFLWLANATFPVLRMYNNEEVPPTRWLVAVLVPLVVAAWALRRQSVDKSGAVLGFLLAFILTLANYLYTVCLFTFFVTSSKATKFRSKQKAKLEHNFKEGGQRNWVQVVCNGGMAGVLGAVALVEVGAGGEAEPGSPGPGTWLSLGVVGTLGAAAGDTWASELGPVLWPARPRLITTLEPVVAGVNGAVSPAGLVASAAGGAAIGLAYVLGSLVLAPARPPWALVAVAAASGFLGSLLDSVLGATLQYSGVDPASGVVVEVPMPGVVHVAGRRLLSNHAVNLVTTVVLGLATPALTTLLLAY